MALVYKNNGTVKFITGTYTGYESLDNRCNCFPRKWCQRVERADSTQYQVGVAANSAELVTAGDFSTACGVDWTCGVDWLIAAGIAGKSSGSTGILSQPVCIMNGRYYRVSVNVIAIAGGVLAVRLGGNLVRNITTTGIKTVFIQLAAITNVQITFQPIVAGVTATIDDVSVQEFCQIGYEIEDIDGNSIFTDVSTSIATRNTTTAQINVDWNQAPLDGCYVICNHSIDEYQEIICNGEFFEDALWTVVSGFVIGGGVADIPGPGAVADMTQTFLHPLQAGRCYTLTFDITNYAFGTLDVSVDAPFIFVGSAAANGSFTFTIDLTSATEKTIISFDSVGAVQLSLDNVSIVMQSACFEEDACSECYQLAATWECTFKLTWTNNENAFGFDYETLTFVQTMRLLGKLWHASYPSERDTFLDNAGTESILFFISQKLQEFNIEEVPEYIHDAHRLGWGHDTVTIDAVNFTKNDNDYDPQHRKSSLLSPVFFNVRDNGQNNKNENCN